MESKEHVYSFTGRVRFSEADEDQHLSLTGLVNYFQDCSTFQSEDLGVGFSYLGQWHSAWILAAWQIVIDRLPVIGERVKASTWAYQFKDFYGLRNYTLEDGAGRVCACANSVWVLLNMETGKPVKIDKTLTDAYGSAPRYEMQYAPRKIKVPDGGREEASFLVDRHHLDTNHHVNNGQYLAMAYAYLPKGTPVRQIRMEYRVQAHLADRICPIVFQEPEKTIVTLTDGAKKVYAVAEFTGS